MEYFFNIHHNELVYSAIGLLVLLIVRFILKSTAKRAGKRGNKNMVRIRLMFQYINIAIIVIAAIFLFLIWGVQIKRLSVLLSSVFAVIGVAFFAIWSILSNITSGVILFFFFPYNIGDKIKINDKDYPIEGIIEDIKTFHLYLRQDNGELTTYPNNLILQKPVSLIKKNAFADKEFED